MNNKHHASVALLALITCLAWLASVDLQSPNTPALEAEEALAQLNVEDLLRTDAAQNPENWFQQSPDVDQLLLAALGKVNPDAAHTCSCHQQAGEDSGAIPEIPRAKSTVQGKQLSVGELIQRALADQAELLQTRQADLQRWDHEVQVNFYRWFGTVDPRARQMVYRRLTILSAINHQYSLRNFREAKPSKPGLFAFVHPNDPSKIFLDKEFLKAPRLGENSRPGTLSHEMSHFQVAGGTKDHVYGVKKCKNLARKDPSKALKNADSFEYFVENAP